MLQSDAHEYIEPSSRARWILAALVGLMVLAYLAFQRLLIGDFSPTENPTDLDVQSLTDALILTTGTTALVSFCISIAATAYLWRLGRRALSSSQFPPPGTLVVKRTRIARGKLAKIEAWLSILLGGILWVAPIFFAYLFLLALEQP